MGRKEGGCGMIRDIVVGAVILGLLIYIWVTK